MIHKTSSSIRRMAALALLLLLARAVFTSQTAAQEGSPPQLTVLAPAVHIRSGPATHYPPFDTLAQGTTVGIIGYNAETGWWQVVSRFGSPGWVSGNAALVAVNEAAVAAYSSPAVPQAVAPAFQPPPAVGIIVFQTASGGPIYAINQDGSNLRYLTTGLDPALSPDGQWVAFTRWDNPQIGALGSLWLINVDGSGERRVMEGVHQPKSPTWSPDGTQVILTMTYGEHLNTVSKCSGERPPRGATDVTVKVEGKDDVVYCYTLLPDPYWGLRRVNVASGQFEDLNYDTHSISPTWDPANPARLVYDGEWGLVSLDLSQGKSLPLTTDVQDRSPVFSPDGSKIAVTYRQDDHWEIHVLNAWCASPAAECAGGRVRLTASSYLTWVQQELNGQMPRSYHNASPAWSPDGSQIAFLTDRTGRWEIWVMDAVCAGPGAGCGSNQRPLFPAGTLAGVPLQYHGVDERVLSWR
ncbi:MAG: SH3 domain-containing protein [Anaerolineae bacterium]|nr:SH3 domain-containing protein [Anaerolineae bacterium]